MPMLPQQRSISNKIRIKWKMNKHIYLKNVKRVRYISAIPQFTGVVGLAFDLSCLCSFLKALIGSHGTPLPKAAQAPRSGDHSLRCSWQSMAWSCPSPYSAIQCHTVYGAMLQALRPTGGRAAAITLEASSQDLLEEKARTEAIVLGEQSPVKLPDDAALAMRARARRRGDWARKRLGGDQASTEEDIPSTDVWGEDQRRAARKKEAKRLATERARTAKERQRAERVAQIRGVQLPTLEEAQSMSLVQLRDVLWNAGYPARGLPSPAEARQMDPEELKSKLKEAKVRFLTQLRYPEEVQIEAEALPVYEAAPRVEEVEAPAPRVREAPRMEIHVPMPEAPAPQVEVNVPMPEVQQPCEAGPGRALRPKA
eukprot:g16423.t1